MSTCCRLLIVTKWGYPFGGGEAFMRDSIDWCQSQFTEIIWLSFMCYDAVSAVHKPWPVYSVNKKSDKVAFVQVPNEMSAATLNWWIKTLDPDVVHHQGPERALVIKTCVNLKVPVVTGFHFWHGAVVLSKHHGNTNIMDHLSDHTIDPELDWLTTENTVTIYFASEFMKQVVLSTPSGLQKTKDYVANKVAILAPVSTESNVCLKSSVDSRRYVTQINVHPGKGGAVIRYCIEQLPSTHFQCLITEDSADDLVSLASHRVLVMSRTEDIATVYARTKVLLVPSVVDETFCRVALEGLMCGLPIMASPAGYLKSMLAQCSGAILMPTTTTCPKTWCSVLSSILENEEKLASMSSASRAYYEKILAPMYNSPATLRSMFHKTMATKSLRNNVMIFAPYADQGLGVQARNYVVILEQFTPAKTAIFSYKPYYAGRHQRNPAEWDHPRCYYSENIRENVTNDEIRKFVAKYEIGTAIIPETCWFRVFEIADYLRSELNVRVYAVPNVEILRTDELTKHEMVFDGLLCNNQICRDVLQRHSEFLGSLTSYIGYAISGTTERPERSGTSSTIRFLCLGGMNAFSRKQIDVVCAAFKAIPGTLDIELIVTNQNECEIAAMTELMRVVPPQTGRITYIWKALNYAEIEQLYTHRCDVVVQVSKHEGLGIGFFEALAHGKPVITLDTPPHNEVIKSGVNGFLVPVSELRQSTENPVSPMKSAFFRTEDLLNCVVNEVYPTMTNMKKRVALEQSLAADYATRFSVNRFAQRFAQALRIEYAMPNFV